MAELFPAEFPEGVFPNVHVYAFAPIDSRMYVLIPRETKHPEILVIDPQINAESIAEIRRVSPRMVYIILTHEHYDHISGVNDFREHFGDRCRVICTASCADRIRNPAKNLSRYFEALFCGHSEAIQNEVAALNIQPYTCEADLGFDREYTMSWDGPPLSMRSTPGHSPGSLCLFVGENVCFTGDTLLQTETILRLPGSNRKLYMEQTLPWLQRLPAGTLIGPGHGEVFRIDPK